MMKRILSCILIAATVLTMAACGGGESAPTTEATTPATTPVTESVAPETTAPPETTVPPETEPVDEGVQLIDVLVGRDARYEMTDDYILLSQVSWQPLWLGAETEAEYPRLADTLERLYNEDLTAALENVEYLTEEAKIMLEEMGSEFNGYTHTSVRHVQRADDRIVSIREEYDILSSMRPFWGTLALNLDPVTGEILYIDDILTDVSELPGLIGDALREQYDYLSEEEITSAVGWLKDYAPEAYTWTLSYQGVTFYFGVSELAAGAVGELRATLWFDEHPGLFVEKYTEAPKNGYALTLSQYEMNDVDLHPGDGQKDELFVFSMVDDELIAGINGSNLYFTDYYAYSYDAYLATCDNEQFYLYVDASGDNDYRTIYVFDLSGETPEYVTELSGIGFGSNWGDDFYNDVAFKAAFNDPTDMILAAKMDILGTRTGIRCYQLNPSTGIPTAKTPYFSYGPYEGTLTSLVELELLILPDQTAEILPAGTEFQVLRTDGSTYMDTRLHDGRECRIPVEKFGWQFMVNGIPEEECFDGIYYAG